MRPTTLVVCLALLASSAVAQIKFEVTAISDLRAYARSNTSMTKTIPLGTKVLNGASLYAASASASARMQVSHTISPGLVNYGYYEDGTASYSSFYRFSGDARVGSHSLGLEFTSPQPVSGTLTIDWQSTVSGNYTQSTSVAIPGLGTFAGRAGVSNKQSYRVTVDANGLVLTQRSSGSCYARSYSTYGRFSGRLAIDFKPDPASFTHYGQGCGPTWTASLDANNKVILAMTAPTQATGIAVFFFGIQNLNLPIPGTNCSMLTDLIISTQTPIDALGNAQVAVPLPSPPFMINAQAAAVLLSGPSIGLTGGIRIQSN